MFRCVRLCTVFTFSGYVSAVCRAKFHLTHINTHMGIHDLSRTKKHTQKHAHTLSAVPAVTNGDQIVYDDDDDVKDQACWSPWLTSFVE